MVDIVVVGGGPVGLAAAVEARLAGLTVTVIEPRTGPIDKACGEGLMPGGIPLLHRLGVSPIGRTLAGVGYFSTTRGVQHHFAAGPALGVRRTALHDVLAARAQTLGIDRITGRADAIEQHGDSITVAVGQVRVQGRWLLGCDGLHSSVARWAGLAAPMRQGGRRFGIRQHFAVRPWSDLIEVHYGPNAELYVTPVADDIVGVAMLAPQGISYDMALAGVPDIAERLALAEPTSERRGAGPFRQRTTARTAGRVLLVGDASGYVDALTGEGLRLGFAQASAAIASVVAGDVSRYEGEWRQLTRDSRMLTSGLVAWAESPLRGALVPAAARLPGLFGAVVERLAR
ncbi:MAG: FAD-dependent monooxygenase [Homoserinimonas sp.]